jgi:hypothetical protein
MELNRVCLILIGLIILYLIYEKNTKQENLTVENTEAINNLTSMYNNGKLLASELVVTGPTHLQGELTTDKSIAVGKDINMGKLVLSNNKDMLNMKNQHGNGYIGMQDTNWFRIQSDRPSFYFDKKISVNGEIAKHNQHGIGNTSRLTAWLKIGGYAVDGRGSTYLLEEGKWSLAEGEKYRNWANDAWNILLLFRGWEITVWSNGDYTGTTKTIKNTTDTVKMINLGLKEYDGLNDKIDAYQLIWRGY